MLIIVGGIVGGGFLGPAYIAPIRVPNQVLNLLYLKVAVLRFKYL